MGWSLKRFYENSFLKTKAKRVGKLITAVKNGTAALSTLSFSAERKAELKDIENEEIDDLQKIKAKLQEGKNLGVYDLGILEGYLYIENGRPAHKDLRSLPAKEHAKYQAILRNIAAKARKVLKSA